MWIFIRFRLYIFSWQGSPKLSGKENRRTIGGVDRLPRTTESFFPDGIDWLPVENASEIDHPLTSTVPNRLIWLMRLSGEYRGTLAKPIHQCETHSATAVLDRCARSPRCGVPVQVPGPGSRLWRRNGNARGTFQSVPRMKSSARVMRRTRRKMKIRTSLRAASTKIHNRITEPNDTLEHSRALSHLPAYLTWIPVRLLHEVMKPLENWLQILRLPLHTIIISLNIYIYYHNIFILHNILPPLFPSLHKQNERF